MKTKKFWNWRKALFQVAHHMRRHTENPRNLIDLELPCLQELRLFRGNRDGRVFHPLL